MSYIDIVNDITEMSILTYDYYLSVSLPPYLLDDKTEQEIMEEVYRLCPELRYQCSINIAAYSLEDRQAIEELLLRYNLDFNVDPVLKEHVTDSERNEL